MFATAVAVEVQVALVTSTGALAVTAVAAILGKRSTDKASTKAGRAASAVEDLAEKIGTPNGDGDVVQMLTTILRGQAGQDARIARLEGVQHELRTGQHDMRAELAHTNGRVDVLERQRQA